MKPLTRHPRWGLLVMALTLVALPVLGTALPANVRIPPVKPHPGNVPPNTALFSHRVHQGQLCYVCHPSIFPQARRGFTHEEMHAGKYCGACHDGKRSAAISTFTCEGCHAPR
jgi:c(7)-type cytochrome triheme protein